MKNFTLLIVLCFLSIFTFGQQATFNWKSDTLSDGHILQKMSINGSSAIIAGFGNSFLKTTNDGETWEKLNLFKPHYNLPDISVKEMVGYIITSREKLYDAFPDVYTNGVILKTIDGGETWEIINAPVFGIENDPSINPGAELCFGIDLTAIETVNDTVAYCAARWYEYLPTGNEDHSGVFKTTDGGINWINISGDLGGSSMSHIVFNSETGFTGGSKQFYKITTSSDSLENIFDLIPGDGSAYVYDIDFVSESEILLTTTADNVFISTDGGDSFTAFEGISGGNDIQRINDSTIVVTGNSNKSYVSTNNGNSWNAMGVPVSIWEIGGVINDSLNLLASASIYKCAVSDLISGNYNFVIQSVGDGNLQKLCISENNKITVVGNDLNFYQSENAGLTWNKIEIPLNTALDEFYENIDFSDLSAVGQEAYACFNRIKFVDYPSTSENDDIYWSGGLMYTDDYWATFKSVDVAKIGAENAEDPTKNPNHNLCNGVNTSALKYLGNDVLLLWVRWYDYSGTERAEHSYVFKTIDAGKNWTPITEDFGGKYVQAIEAAGDTIYIAGKEILLKSVDAGESFTNLYPILDEGEDDAMFINMIRLGKTDELFVVTAADSCFMSIDGGNSFKTFGGIAGSNDFYKFDENSYILMGVSGKSVFTNNGGETWENCQPANTVFEIGGILNHNFYALGKSCVFINALDNFDIKTSAPLIKSPNKIQLQYHSDYINIVSLENTISRCFVYSATGQLMTIKEPNSNLCRLNNFEYKPGIYIIVVSVKGEKLTEKVVFN